MSITAVELNRYLGKLLNIYEFEDYCPNGLQIEGKENIKKLAFAVSATRDSIQRAVQWQADALLVHHGLFWKFHGTRTITGPFAKRIIPLITNQINLYGYHLPLDAHLELGNAASLANLLLMQDLKPFGDYKGMPTGVWGKTKKISHLDFATLLKKHLNHDVIHSCPEDRPSIERVAIITGGANSDWIKAHQMGMDAYITGEISEHDWHEAKEAGIHMFAGGHNATEQFGIYSLMEHLESEFEEKNLEFKFFQSDNPA